MRLDGKKVVVVGGAIGGAGAALLLARAGARVTLLERVARPQAAGAGIALAENGMAVLGGLGLGPALERVGRAASPRLVDARSRRIFRPRQAPRVLMVRRADLHEALLAAVAAEPAIEVRMGAEVAVADPAGRVTLASGEAIEADLVVGADGVHSRVRDAGDFGASVERTGVTYVRGLVDEAVAADEEAWTRAGIFGSFPVEGGTYLYASQGDAACRRALADRDLPALRDAWARLYAPACRILGAVESFDRLLLNEVIRVRCRRFAHGRLVLIGDAAHAMAPNLGQGGNSALVDAAVLVAELQRADELDAALRAYDRRRRDVVAKVADTAARLGALAEWTSAPARLLRDRVLMPLAGVLTGARAAAQVLQEPPEVLLGIARGA